MTDQGDEMLIEELRAVIGRVDPVPPRLDEAARGAFTWRTVDAELAELMLDSADAESAELLVRGAAGPRQLSFESPRLAVELEVVDAGPRERRLEGQLLPPAAASVTVEQDAGRRAVEADELGRFAVDGLSAGPARLRIAIAGGEVTLPWTAL
jgi:hypothetical protein